MIDKPLKYSKDGIIAFRDFDHLYFLKSDERITFTSCTTFFKQFEEKKDWKKIKNAYASKNKLTIKEVEMLWDEKRDVAATQGTAIHVMLENLIQGLDRTANNNEHVLNYPKYVIAQKFYDEWIGSGKWTPVEVEGILYDMDLMIAGQRDLKIRDEEGRLCVVDYKTNVEMKPAFSEGGVTTKLLPPFNSLEDSYMVKYSLQLALYDYMDPDPIYKRYIVHIQEDKYEIIETLPLELEVREGKLQLHRSYKYTTEEENTPPVVRFFKFKTND